MNVRALVVTNVGAALFMIATGGYALRGSDGVAAGLCFLLAGALLILSGAIWLKA